MPTTASTIACVVLQHTDYYNKRERALQTYCLGGNDVVLLGLVETSNSLHSEVHTPSVLRQNINIYSLHSEVHTPSVLRQNINIYPLHSEVHTPSVLRQNINIYLWGGVHYTSGKDAGL